MKSYFLTLSRILIIAAGFFLVISTACKKDEDNNSDDIFWNPNWLIGTWEGTPPAVGNAMFDNKKMRLVIDEVVLKHTDTVPNNTVKLWYYSGTLSWDVDGTAPWSMHFVHEAYPIGLCSFDWQSATLLQANVTINNISLRVGDTVSMAPNREIDFDLDWGPYNDYDRKAPTILDFYGDIEIYIDGNNYRADYPPNAGEMIRLTKK
jgi:hypothetical protein